MAGLCERSRGQLREHAELNIRETHAGDKPLASSIPFVCKLLCELEYGLAVIVALLPQAQRSALDVTITDMADPLVIRSASRQKTCERSLVAAQIYVSGETARTISLSSSSSFCT